MKTLSPSEPEHDLKLLFDKQRRNRVVVVCPRFEEWLIKTARQANLAIADFNLSGHPLHLHSEINQRLGNLRTLLEALLEAKSPRILKLKSLLTGAHT